MSIIMMLLAVCLQKKYQLENDMFALLHTISKAPLIGPIVVFGGCFYLALWNFLFNRIPSYILRKLILRYLYGMKIGKGSNIHYGVKFLSPWLIEVGDNVNIQMGSFIDGRGRVTIRDNVDITIGVNVLSQQHDIYSETYATVSKPVGIGSNSVIGSFSLIMPGATINEGGVLAAGSVLVGEIPRYSLYAGNPAVFKRKRDISCKYNVSYQRLFH